MEFTWKDYSKEQPKDNGRLQKFLVCRDKPSASCGKVSIDAEFFTDKFKDDRKITHWAPLPIPETKNNTEMKGEVSMAKTLKYSTLRYSPSGISGEQINLGIIFYEEKEKIRKFRFIKNFKRLEAFDDEVDANVVKILLKGIKEDVEDKSKEFCMEEYIKYYVNAFNFSEVRTSLYENVEETMEQLFKMYFRFEYKEKERPKQ